MSGITQLDLSQPVTMEQYNAAIAAMFEFLNGELKERFNWCSERHRYFTAIIPNSHTEDAGFDYQTVIDQVDPEADFAALLKEARGKILWYAMNGPINLATANEIFAACGLPEYVTKRDEGVRLSITMPAFNVSVRAGNNNDARAWARDHFMEFMGRMLDGKPAQNDDLYVPGSVTFSGVERPYATAHGATRPPIDETDMVRPSYR